MQGELCTWLITVDQASIGFEAGKASRRSGVGGQAPKYCGHFGPGTAGRRIGRRIAIAVAVRDPADLTAIGHRHRHAVSAGCHHIAERRSCRNLVYSGNEPFYPVAREALQNDRGLAELSRRAWQGEMTQQVAQSGSSKRDSA